MAGLEPSSRKYVLDSDNWTQIVYMFIQLGGVIVFLFTAALIQGQSFGNLEPCHLCFLSRHGLTNTHFLTMVLANASCQAAPSKFLQVVPCGPQGTFVPGFWGKHTQTVVRKRSYNTNTICWMSPSF